MASVATEVAPDRGERLLIWVGFPLVGAVAGGLVKALAGWAASWEWVPAHDALRLMASLRNPWGKVGLAVLGALAGAGVAFLAEREHLAELDGELAGLGVVLREVKRRQYWRRVRTDA